MNLDLFPSPAVDLDAEIRRMDRFAPLEPHDVCRGRHLGNDESEAANARIHATKEEARLRILDLVRAAGEYGITSKELAVQLGKEVHTFSGRLSEMKQDGRIVATGIVRDGARALVAKG